MKMTQLLGRRLLVAAASMVLGVSLVCAQANEPYLVGKKKGPFVVGLSNSFSGNSWRAQMVAEFKVAADKLKKSGVLKDYIVADATGNTASQIQQIQNMIARGVNAIVIDANSETALNPVIEQAHKKGIIVVAFDNTVSSPAALNVTTDQNKFGSSGAEWLAKRLGGKGNVVVLNGVAGTPVNNARWGAAKAVFDKYPDIKIINNVNANWDQATAQQAVANLLPSFPKIDGIWSQGGAMTLGAVYAFQAANRPLIPMSGEANNGLLKVWKQNVSKGFDCLAPAQPPSLSVEALNIAIKALNGEKVQKDLFLDPDLITAETLDKYVRMDMPDSLWHPTNLGEAELKVLFK